ncbi:amino acid permease-domain-containing protein, partial [Multifurca ochricompacta]
MSFLRSSLRFCNNGDGVNANRPGAWRLKLTHVYNGVLEQHLSFFLQAISMVNAVVLEDPSTAAGERRLSLLNGIALMIGTQVKQPPFHLRKHPLKLWVQIGSGIFASPGIVVASTKSSSSSVAVWFIAALIAWTGASSFAELGAALPQNGGPRVFLGYTYGPLMSFLYSWISIFLIFPGSQAATSLVFAEYVNRVLWNATRGDDLPSLLIPESVIQVTAIFVIVLAAFIAVKTPALGPRVAVIYMTMKVLALLAIIVFGLLHGILNHSIPKSIPGPDPESGVVAYTRAIFACLFAYQGFHAFSFVCGEMQNPGRDIARSINYSMSFVTVLFSFVNCAYFSVLDPEIIARRNTVALDFGWACSALLEGPALPSGCHFLLGLTQFFAFCICTAGLLSGTIRTTPGLFWGFGFTTWDA